VGAGEVLRVLIVGGIEHKVAFFLFFFVVEAIAVF